MVPKNQIKLVTSLQQKKYRTQHGLFVAEGVKLVNELLEGGIEPHGVYVVNEALADQIATNCEVVSPSVLKKMSSLSSPNGVLGVFHMPKKEKLHFEGWAIILDSIRDPGNLGTIIRLCDWFDIKYLICSPDTVDCYNPKVLQATMGSIARVEVQYLDLEDFLKKNEHPVYGAFMDGTNMYGKKLGEQGILVMGNEANGISSEVEKYVTERIGIPQFGEPTTESLNVATATAILLSEIRRN
ncbi:TrmH family RNA methyltransferase [Flagellimonas allohymeniacidonis]|uniref:RNA methyltransferase n=1 Tax=Flagellimonas allohymeniacidonis TaxID=2517819 RepID=A0A4Q8QFF0_9FLAO|nr:RNA methyltransferase [Allomuricauda hymeniacidonis]TAI46826.1 RNA methyltransferase [Allomuricauda hymeniacidonis]